MKINVRILLITFSVVALISVTSTLIFYSLTNSIIQNQNSSTILNSSNDFVFLLEASLDRTEDDFQRIFNNTEIIPDINLKNTEIDLLFELNENNLIDNSNFKSKEGFALNYHGKTIEAFLDSNPNAIIKFKTFENGKTVFYGKIITQKFLDDAAKKIRAEVALVINDLPYTISNPADNSVYQINLVQAYSKLKYKNNFDLLLEEKDDADLAIVKYQPKNLLTANSKLEFLIFNTFSDSADFLITMRGFVIVIILTGVLLSFIFALLFTTKIRKQLSLLSSAAKITATGNLEHRVSILSKDELGKLGESFNAMLDELNRNKIREEEYAEFITLINKNPSLLQFAESTLTKILQVIGLKFGAIYTVENGIMHVVAAKGYDKTEPGKNNGISIYQDVISKHEFVELEFEDNLPIIKAGVVDVRIKYLLVIPIIYNDVVIGVLEFASEFTPTNNPQKYLNSIIEQLAIGLNNAVIFEKLQNFVAELKELNEEYQHQNEQIKGQNAELIELHKQLKEKAEELDDQRRKAVELTHVKSQFLASMSHELKTPLNSIIGLTELCEQDSGTLPKTKDRLKIVLRNGKKLLTMINNILEFSKIESGKFEVSKTNFLLSNFLNEIYLSANPLVTEKKLKFKISLQSESDLLINTDKEKFEHIVLNLLSNAIKFTDKGSINIIAERIESENLRIAVVDSGIGIDENNQKTIFEEFKQLDSGNNRRYSGAGLGLAICKKYSELLNGELTVKSNQGEGSEFSLYLPGVVVDEIEGVVNVRFSGNNKFAQIDRSEDRSKEKEIEKSNTPLDDLINEESMITNIKQRILIVDDDSDTLFTVGEILQNLGYEISFASNGLECLQQIEKTRPDMVLLDIMMPVMDGFETIKKIRKNPKYDDLLVIALTAHAMLDDKHVIEETGFNDLIPKPVNRITLQVKISQIFANKERDIN